MDSISEIECKNVLKNFIKMTISIICYLRNLFSETVFEDAKIGDLHLKRLTRSLPESSTLIDLIDYGIYETIVKEYLKTLVITIHDSSDLSLESYYITLNGTKSSNSMKGNSINKDVIKRNTVRSLKELILLIQSLSPIYDYSYLSIMLLYFDSAPADYEPKFFRSSLDHSINSPFIPITKMSSGYIDLEIELYTVANVNENLTSYLSRSTTKCLSTNRRSPSTSSDTSELKPEDENLMILDLINKSEALCQKYRFISKDTLSASLAVSSSIAKVLLKKLIDKNILDSKHLKNKGYKSRVHLDDGQAS